MIRAVTLALALLFGSLSAVAQESAPPGCRIAGCSFTGSVDFFVGLTIGTNGATSATGLSIRGNGTAPRFIDFKTAATVRSRLALNTSDETVLLMYDAAGANSREFVSWEYDVGDLATPHRMIVGNGFTTAQAIDSTFSGLVKARNFSTFTTVQTLSGSGTPAVLVSAKQDIAGTSTFTGGYELNQFGANSDSLAVDSGSVYYLSGQGQLKAGQTGGRTGVYGNVTRNVATTLIDGGDTSIGVSGHAISNVTAGGSSSGLGFTQFGMGNHFGLLGKARVSGTATGYRSNVVQELDVAVADSATVASVVGLQIVHESDHARGAPRWGANVAMGIASQSLTAGPSYSDKGWDVGLMFGGVSGGAWSFKDTAVLIRLHGATGAGGTYPLNAAGFADALQGNFAGTSPGGGGFLLRGAGVRVNPSDTYGGEIQIGAASLRGTSAGAELDLNYQQVTAVTVASGGTLWATGDMAEDVYGNVYTVAGHSGGVITSITLTRSGWRTATVGTPVAISAISRNGTTYGTGATVTLSTWTPRTALSIQPSGGLTTFGGHIATAGTAPTVSSCGTSPSAVTGNDTAGKLTMGTASPTACTLTFAGGFAAAPKCTAVASVGGAALAVAPTTVSTSAVTFTTSAAATSGTLTYHCVQ